MTLTQSGRPAVGADRTANNTYPHIDGIPRGHHRASYEAGWRDGSRAAITWAAERADALDLSWRPLDRRTPEQVRADRFASLEPVEGTAAWLEAARQKTLRTLGFVSSADRLTPALIAAGIKVSPLAGCDWPPVRVPGAAYDRDEVVA